MPVNSIPGSVSNYVNKVLSGGASNAPGSAAPSALQEASETATVTAKEARGGDRVAIAKLKLQQDQAQVRPHDPGKGGQIDHHA